MNKKINFKLRFLFESLIENYLEQLVFKKLLEFKKDNLNEEDLKFIYKMFFSSSFKKSPWKSIIEDLNVYKDIKIRMIFYGIAFEVRIPDNKIKNIMKRLYYEINECKELNWCKDDIYCIKRFLRKFFDIIFNVKEKSSTIELNIKNTVLSNFFENFLNKDDYKYIKVYYYPDEFNEGLFALSGKIEDGIRGFMFLVDENLLRKEFKSYIEKITKNEKSWKEFVEDFVWQLPSHDLSIEKTFEKFLEFFVLEKWDILRKIFNINYRISDFCSEFFNRLNAFIENLKSGHIVRFVLDNKELLEKMKKACLEI